MSAPDRLIGSIHSLDFPAPTAFRDTSIRCDPRAHDAASARARGRAAIDPWRRPTSLLVTRADGPIELLRQRAPFARVGVFDDPHIMRAAADDHAVAGGQ